MVDPTVHSASESESTPEFRLLLACSRRTPDAGLPGQVAEYCQNAFDWSAFLNLVARHRVAPLVWNSLKSIDDPALMPARIQDALRRTVENNTLEAMKQAAELVRLLRRFENADVRVLSIKGPVLAVQAYQALELRHAGDLDLLIDPGSVWDADRILHESGYVRTIPEYDLSGGQAAAFMKIRKDFTYHHPGRNLYVELHWRLCQNAYLLPLGLDELWLGREFVQFGAEPVAGMGLQDLLLYLCAHGAHTGWFRLKWLCDVAELLDGDRDIDMSKLLGRAQDLGMRRMLLQALLLAETLLDVPLPAAIPRDAASDRKMQRLIGLSTHALLQEERYWSTDQTPISWMPAQVRYRLSLRADMRYKWHNLYFYSLWTDACQRIRLPRRLYPLYFFLAPFPWLISLFKRQNPASASR